MTKKFIILCGRYRFFFFLIVLPWFGHVFSNKGRFGHKRKLPGFFYFLMWIPDFPFKKIPPRPVGIPWESKPPNVAPQKKLVPPMPLRTNSRSRHTGCPLPMLPATAFDVDRQLVHLKSWSVIQIWCESKYGEPLMGGMLQFQHWKNRFKTALTGWILVDRNFWTNIIKSWLEHGRTLVNHCEEDESSLFSEHQTNLRTEENVVFQPLEASGAVSANYSPPGN